MSLQSVATLTFLMACLVIHPTFAGTPALPSAEELALIEDGIAAKLLDPESAVLSEVVTTPDNDNPSMTWVCGNVKGRNTFGGYAQPVAFLGTLIAQNNGERVFLPIAIAGASPAEQASVLATCLQHFDTIN